MQKFTVLIGVDTETDVGSFTPFYESIPKCVPILLDIFDEKQCGATFYFTGECAKENPEIAKMVAERGYEVGAHSLYHETVGDELFPIPGVKPLLPHEVEPRLKLATEWIEEASGVHPTAFRCPRLWGSTAVVNALEKLGYTSDATYPMYFYRERFNPYYPSREDWTKEGDSPVLEIPNFADMVMESNDGDLQRDRDQWPEFRTKGAKFVADKVAKYLEFAKGKGIDHPVIAFYIHPWEFMECAPSYHFGESTVMPDEFIIRNTGDVAIKELRDLIDMLKEMGGEFKSAGQIVEDYKK